MSDKTETKDQRKIDEMRKKILKEMIKKDDEKIMKFIHEGDTLDNEFSNEENEKDVIQKN